MHLRALSVLGACVLSGALLSAPANASVFTETLSFSGSPSTGGDTVNGPVFNPALGTLSGVTMIASGTYTPHVFVGAPVSGTASVLDVDLITYGAGGGLTTVAAGGEDLTYSGGYLNGSAEGFTETATVTTASALSQIYTAFGPYQSGSLLGLDVFSKPAISGAWGSLADDVSHYAGTLTVSFAYAPALPVPEPASLALFGLGGVITLLFARRRRSETA